VSGQWAGCEGYQLPTPETCNGRDDDCNGAPDDGCGGGGTGGTGGDGGGASGLRLYHRVFGAGPSSFVSEPVEEHWTGPNAPDAAKVVAADASQGVTPAWLLVLGEEGTLYVRQGEDWLAPQPVDTVFAGLDAAMVNSVLLWQPEEGGNQSVQVSARTTGPAKVAYFYDLALPSLAATPDPKNPITVPDEPDPNAPPHNIVDIDWDFIHQTAHLGEPHWVMFYMQVGANSYVFDGGDFSWGNLGPSGTSTVWGSDPTQGPDPSLVRAAWLTEGELYLLAP
jgi:hypothetical protein